MDHKEIEMHEPVDGGESVDSKADAFAAVVLISVFVAVCTFWISGQ